MAAFLLTPGVPIRALDADGNPVSGAKLRVFEAGTSTPLTVYQDLALATPHATPVVADADGYFAPIYFTGPDSVKVRIDDASDVVLSTQDHLAGLPTSTTGAADTSFAATARVAADDVQEAIEDVDRVLEKTQAGLDRIVTTGSANAYVLDTAVSSYTAYATGDLFLIEANHANTGAATLNVDSLGAKAIKFRTGGAKVDPASGEIQAGHILRVEYDGTDFVVIDHWRPMATQAQAEAGAAQGVLMDPLRTKQAIDENGVFLKIRTATASASATVEFDETDFDSTKFTAYKIIFSDVITDTDAVSLRMRLQTAGGAFRSGASDYYYDAADSSASSAQAFIQLNNAPSLLGAGVGEDGFSGEIIIYGAHTATRKTKLTWSGVYWTSSGTIEATLGAGVVNAAEENDGIQFLCSSGSISSGTFTLYGIA